MEITMNGGVAVLRLETACQERKHPLVPRLRALHCLVLPRRMPVSVHFLAG